MVLTTRGGGRHVKGGGRIGRAQNRLTAVILFISLFTLSRSCQRHKGSTGLTRLIIEPTGADAHRQLFHVDSYSSFKISCRVTGKWQKLTELKLQVFDADMGSYIDLVISSELHMKNLPDRAIWANINSGFFSKGRAKYGMNPERDRGIYRELQIEISGPNWGPEAQYRCTSYGYDEDGYERIDHSPRAFVFHA